MNIEIHNLSKEYAKVTVLDIPQLNIASGEVIGLVGNNGAGKTTMLRLMLDLIEATSGYVKINGMVVNEMSDWKNFTGSHIDEHFLVPFYTPEEFFAFVAKLYGIGKGELERRLEKFSPLMGGEVLGCGKQIRQLSEGNKQKVGIIAAMMIEPKVLILDEPFNYLDPTSQIETARMIKDMAATVGTTVIVSSHNLTSVTEISTRILLLEKGKIIKDIKNDSEEARNELNRYFVPEEE